MHQWFFKYVSNWIDGQYIGVHIYCLSTDLSDLMYITPSAAGLFYRNNSYEL